MNGKSVQQQQQAAALCQQTARPIVAHTHTLQRTHARTLLSILDLRRLFCKVEPKTGPKQIQESRTLGFFPTQRGPVFF